MTKKLKKNKKIFEKIKTKKFEVSKFYPKEVIVYVYRENLLNKRKKN